MTAALAFICAKFGLAFALYGFLVYHVSEQLL